MGTLRQDEFLGESGASRRKTGGVYDTSGPAGQQGNEMKLSYNTSEIRLMPENDEDRVLIAKWRDLDVQFFPDDPEGISLRFYENPYQQ